MKQKFIFCLVLLTACNSGRKEFLTFPYSQWTVGSSGRNISWFFDSGTGLELNNSFIARPEAGRWEEWYQSIRDYRQITRNRIGKEEPALNCRISARNPATIHFDKFGYGLNLIPGEEIEFEGKISPPLTHAHAALILYFDFELKSRGEELSNVVRKRIGHADSLMIPDEPEIFKMRLQVPDFRSDSFSISPVLRLESPNAVVSMDVIVSDLSLTVAASPERNVLLSKIQSMIRSQKDSISFTTPRYPEWMHGNFVMGFAFLWDRELWDPERGEFTVEEYCRKMEEEFGGLQSVILWHSYPNIGIDERNQFDFFHIMPGGLEGLKKVVVDFQVNGVRVFLAYNPWDLDTRRPGESDGRELGIILDSTWADGIFLDTWNSAAGMNSIFSSERLFSDEFRKKNIVFIAELFPEYKDMIGSHALAGSWGQQINPFHFTDLSQLKWIAPEHKQYYIERLATDRHQMLAHAWINGQGIQVWENIFGTMNFWNVRDKMDLRRINSIWKSFGNMYSSDDWQPLIPMNEAGIYASRWTTGGQSVWNFIDSADAERMVRIQTDLYHGMKFYDLWNGLEIIPAIEKGRSFIKIPVRRFGCLLATDTLTGFLRQFLAERQKENPRELQAALGVRIKSELSLNQPLRFSYPRIRSPRRNIDLQTINIRAGTYRLTCKHIWREGECYPGKDAKNNHDLEIIFEEGTRKIRHRENISLKDFSIMSSVVTNGEFEKFLNTSKYQPRHPENFLKHWNGNTCPQELKDRPVVYVSLEDARAFAGWAGMQLPTEWEWQAAAETLKDEFRYNDVFEWNESERFDGFNRFVNLRGGCRTWKTPSSWWYLPGAPYGEVAGGEQPYDSHVKYFLMYPGIDRASTIGFRCLVRSAK